MSDDNPTSMTQAAEKATSTSSVMIPTSGITSADLVGLRHLLLARRLRLAPLWVLLSNPRKIHILLVRLVGFLVVSVLGGRRLWTVIGSRLPRYESGTPVGSSRIVAVPHIGRLLVPFDSSPVLVEQFLLEIYDWFFRPSTDWVIFDVGAHAGVFSVKCARAAKRGRVIALEPYRGNFRYLLENLRINAITNVDAFELAAYSMPGKLQLYLNRERSDCHSIRCTSSIGSRAKGVPITATTLDELAQKLRLPLVDLVKIDVEGAEIQVLYGATNTLKICKRVCVAAYHVEGEVKEVSEYLEGRGFSVFSLDSYVYAIRQDR